MSVWSAGMQLLCQHSFGTKRAKSRRCCAGFCFVYSCFFFLFRQRNSSRAAFHTGDDGAAMVCGQRNGDEIARQQRKGKLLSEVVCALPYLSHYSLKYIVSCFSPHVGNGSAGEQTSADQYLRSPSKGGVSRLGWSRGASPSAGKKKRNEIFSYFSSSHVYELLPTSRTRRGKSYLTHRLSYFFFSFWLLCLCQLNRGTLKEKIAAL